MELHDVPRAHPHRAGFGVLWLAFALMLGGVACTRAGFFPARSTDASAEQGGPSDSAPVALDGAAADALAPPIARPQWALGLGGMGPDKGYALAADASNNIYLCGAFSDVVAYSGTTSLTSSGGEDVLVVSYTASGERRWATRFGGAAEDRGAALFVDGDSLFVAGYFSGTADFDTTSLTAAGTQGAFVAKLDATSGAVVWVLHFGGTGTLNRGDALASDGQGGLYVTGVISGPGGVGGADLLDLATPQDAYLARFDGAGQHLWGQRFGGLDASDGRAVVVDEAGGVYLAGHFRGTGDFGSTLTSTASWQTFLSSFDAAGQPRWARRLGGGDGQVMTEALAISRAGQLYLAGFFIETADLGAGIVDRAAYEFWDGFVSSFTTAGGHVWTRQFEGASSNHNSGLALDGRDNVFVTGDFYNWMRIEGGRTLIGNGIYDLFVVALTPAGDLHWAQSLGGADRENDPAIALDGGDNILLTGEFSGSSDLGASSIDSVGDTDIFLLKLAPTP